MYMTKKQPLQTARAAIYARVSSQKQKEGETIASQVSSLKALAEKKGYRIPDTLVFLDDGVSGSILQRPALDELRDIIRTEPLDFLFIYSPDRLSRNYTYQLMLLEEFRRRGLQICFLNAPQEANSSEARMLAHMQGIFAEYERSLILDRSRRGRMHKAKNNDPSILPCVPYGYERRKSGSQTIVIVNEEQSKIVKEIFRLYTQESFTLNKLVSAISKIAPKSPKGNSKWHPSTIRGILKNQAYIGSAHYGKTEKGEGLQYDLIRHCNQKVYYGSKNARRRKPEAEWFPIDMPQIISESDFELAQEKLKENTRHAARNTREPGLLQGLIICGACGEPFYKRSRKYGSKRVSTYHCRSRNRKEIQTCNNGSIRQLDLDNLIFTEVLELLRDPYLVKEEIARRAEQIADKEEGKRKEILVKKELSKLILERDRLLDAYQGGLINLEELRKRNYAADIRKKDLEKTLQGIQASKMEIGKDELEQCFKTIGERIQLTANNLTFKDQRKLVRLLIEKIIVKNDEIKIVHCISPRSVDLESGQLRLDDCR